LKGTLVLHSWHSQAADTISRTKLKFDWVIALDSFPDIYTPSLEMLAAFPTPLIRLAARRCATHSEIRRATANLDRGEYPSRVMNRFNTSPIKPQMRLAVPAKVLLVHTDYVRQHMSMKVSIEQLISDLTMIYATKFGIQLYSSPPQKLMNLPLSAHKNRGNTLLDIDATYLYEMQPDCYTPVQGARAEDLGHTAPVLSLIKKTKPSLITLSEVTNAALNDTASQTNNFINTIKRRGYTIEDGGVLDGDDTPIQTLRLFKEYYDVVQAPLLARKEHLREGGRERMITGTKQFFARRMLN